MSVKPDSLLIRAVKQVGYMQLKPLRHLFQRVQPWACTITDVPNRGLWHSAQLRGLPDRQTSLLQDFFYFDLHNLCTSYFFNSLCVSLELMCFMLYFIFIKLSEVTKCPNNLTLNSIQRKSLLSQPSF